LSHNAGPHFLLIGLTTRPSFGRGFPAFLRGTISNQATPVPPLFVMLRFLSAA
jgi:hypothetical protein